MQYRIVLRVLPLAFFVVEGEKGRRCEGEKM
jgi:hypothetical protein